MPQRDLADSVRVALKKLSDIHAKEKPALVISPTSSNGSNLRINSVSQFKSYSIRMIKALKEDLAKI